MMRHFRNEHGNDVDIDVSKEEVGGVEGVMISFTGPDAETELAMTKGEAQALYEVLGSVLGWKR